MSEYIAVEIWSMVRICTYYLTIYYYYHHYTQLLQQLPLDNNQNNTTTTTTVLLLTAAWKSSSDRIFDAFAIAAIASSATPACFMPILEVRIEGTSAAAPFNTLQRIIYLMQVTAVSLVLALLLLLLLWSYASNAW